MASRGPGRPPMGERALTAAEKQRRYREKLAQARGAARPATETAPAPDRAALEVKLRAEIETRLRAEYEAREAKLRAEMEALRARKTIEALGESIPRGRSQRAMSFALYGKIAKGLHSDSRPTEAQRLEAYHAFTEWWQSNKPKKSKRW